MKLSVKMRYWAPYDVRPSQIGVDESEMGSMGGGGAGLPVVIASSK